jgi:hypothetical protein
MKPSLRTPHVRGCTSARDQATRPGGTAGGSRHARGSCELRHACPSSLCPRGRLAGAGGQASRVHCVPASRCSQVTTVASTTRFRACLECLPHRTVAVMRPQDIAIKVSVAIEHPTRTKRTFAWPPLVVPRAVSGPFEGLPRRIGVYQGSTLVGKREVLVLIVFGRAVPTDRQLNRANSGLRRSRIA